MRNIFVCLALLCGLGMAAFATSKTRSNRPPKVKSTDDQVDADTRLCRDAARILVAGFAHDLKTDLIAAMKKGGTANAVSVCGDRAPQIAADHSEGGWTIHRVSDRNRNPNDAPDSLEQAMLADFSSARGKNRALFKDVWTEKDSVKTYHFFEPIVTQDFCLRCHGSKESMDASVATAISAKYPNDLATGYSEGEVRGMFVVETKWPEGRAQALELTGRSH